MRRDFGERSLGVQNAGPPRALECRDRRQCEPLLPEMSRDGRERAPHLVLLSRPERKGDEAEAREADVDFVQIELERMRNRACLLFRELRHSPIAARSRPPFVT